MEVAPKSPKSGFLSRSSHSSTPPNVTLENTIRIPRMNDESISFQIDSRLRENSSHVSSIPLQLLEQSAQNSRVENGFDERGAGLELNGNPEEKDDADDDDGERAEEFRILGHAMCLNKRRRDREDSLCSSSSKRVSVNYSLESRCGAVKSWGNQLLVAADPEIFEIMEKEKSRQVRGIELIASENFVCRAVMEALGSHLTNKYSEGMPGARYYGGNQYIDEIETLCWQRALAAFDLNKENWGVNVQPYSCTSANFAVYTGLLLPGDRIMGLDTLSGGNTSHGCYTPTGRKVSGASIFFESLSYKVNPQTGFVDYDRLEERAVDYRPKILISGGSSYPREWDYARLRQIADKCGAILMCDMAQISGLIAAKECVSPFDYCDIVTSTTHKSLRGPRGGIIFYRKGKRLKKRGVSLNSSEDEQYDFEDKINFAVFPALQGGPHNNHIAALAIALKQAITPEYKAYMQQVKKNAQFLASALLRRNCKLVTGGTDNHMLLWDLRPCGLTGSSKLGTVCFRELARVKLPQLAKLFQGAPKGLGKNFEKVCEMCHMTLNKVLLHGDNGAISSGGVRIGTTAMTTRGCVETDFETIADFLVRAAKITNALQREHGKAGFLKALESNNDIIELRAQVENFAAQFTLPGFDSVNSILGDA